MGKSKANSIDWLEGFGQSKQHDIFFVRSAESPIKTALAMKRLFRRPFRMLGAYPLLSKHPDRLFPIFFSTLNVSQEANLMLIPNSVTIPAQELGNDSDFLLGGFLFDEESFIFNNQGNFLFQSDFTNYEYMLILSCNRNFQIGGEVVDVLSSVPALKMIHRTDLLELAAKKAVEKSRVDFLQRLIIDMEIDIGTFMEEELCRRLNYRTTIPAENWTRLRFEERLEGRKIPLNSLLNSPLMRREDV